MLTIFRRVLTDAARDGEVRTDVPVDEVALYCLHALAAAGGLPPDAAVRRLVALIDASLKPGPSAAG